MQTLFTPYWSLGGGMLIGLSAVLLMLGLGRIFGASGIMSGFAFYENRSEWSWRAALILGMLLAPNLLLLIRGSYPEVNIEMSPIMIVLGGIIVGLGTSLASGCTSGHGVCGLSRLSRRSLVAVPVFMSSVAITVFIIRHVIGS